MPVRGPGTRRRRIPDGRVRRAGPAGRAVGRRVRGQRVVAGRLSSPAQGGVFDAQGDGGRGRVHPT